MKNKQGITFIAAGALFLLASILLIILIDGISGLVLPPLTLGVVLLVSGICISVHMPNKIDKNENTCPALGHGKGRVVGFYSENTPTNNGKFIESTYIEFIFINASGVECYCKQEIRPSLKERFPVGTIVNLNVSDNTATINFPDDLPENNELDLEFSENKNNTTSSHRKSMF